LSARKRRPRRNPPRGQFSAQLGDAAPATEAPQQQVQGAPEEKCALLERTPDYAAASVHPEDDDSSASESSASSR
jgi:hypothetical protein